jgi:hypothetical protein
MARGRRKFNSRLWGVALVTVAALLALTALAVAAAPVKGGSYKGHLTVSSSQTVSFKVSSDGKKVTGLKGPEFPPNTCGSGGPPPGQSVAPASISNGKFTAVIKYKTATKHVFAKVTVKGKFKKNKKEAGTMRTHFTAAGGTMCEKTFAYSTKAS